MRIVTVVGARPQYIKAAFFSREFRINNIEILVNTGQHYDSNMTDVFFKELGIPEANYNLGIGSGSHGYQTSKMIEEIERILSVEKPDSVLVFGDTNSTLSGALAACKIHIPVIHVEAGLRSYNKKMPEEINRLLTDHLSSLLICPSQTGVNNLAKEGITDGVYNLGDIMIDSLNFALRYVSKTNVIERNNLKENEYYLLTLHRAENTDNFEKLEIVLETLLGLEKTVVFPVHPRTRKLLSSSRIYKKNQKKINFIDPVGYFDIISLLQSCSMLITDSGGLQKEAYWLRKPCVTLRTETEWIETILSGWNILSNIDRQEIVMKVTNFKLPKEYEPFYGEYGVSKRVVELIENYNFA